ncbi:hypothetical protein ACFLQ1_00290 [Candidatus Auribacterota bacterium]
MSLILNALKKAEEKDKNQEKNNASSSHAQEKKDRYWGDILVVTLIAAVVGGLIGTLFIQITSKTKDSSEKIVIKEEKKEKLVKKVSAPPVKKSKVPIKKEITKKEVIPPAQEEKKEEASDRVIDAVRPAVPVKKREPAAVQTKIFPGETREKSITKLKPKSKDKVFPKKELSAKSVKTNFWDKIKMKVGEWFKKEDVPKKTVDKKKWTGKKAEKKQKKYFNGFKDIKLTGIMWDANAPLAIINGDLVKEGDTVDNAKVLKIEESQIIVEFNNKEYILYL